ncbi:hypothetical protein ACJZ2D_009429 [Fusarium nematophilum]
MAWSFSSSSVQSHSIFASEVFFVSGLPMPVLPTGLLYSPETTPAEVEAHVVGAELNLVPVVGGAGPGVHDAGVEEEDVEAVGALAERLGRFPDSAGRPKVHLAMQGTCHEF